MPRLQFQKSLFLVSVLFIGIPQRGCALGFSGTFPDWDSVIFSTSGNGFRLGNGHVRVDK